MFGSPIGKPTKYVIGGSYETLAEAKAQAAKFKRKGVVEYRLTRLVVFIITFSFR